MSTIFPLFSLPYVPLKQILDDFGQQGILTISLCSQRMKNVAIAYRGPSKNTQLELNSGTNGYLSYSINFVNYELLHVETNSNLPERRHLNTVTIGNFYDIPVEMGEKGLKTYWSDHITGLFAIGEYAREIFNRNIFAVILGREQAENDHRRVIDWVMRTQKSIEDVYCEFKPRSDEDVDYILENCKYTEYFTFFVKPSDGYSPAKMPNFNVENLYLSPSFWVNTNHLLTMNCKTITLQDSKLTHKELNLFLKHWMNGGCYELKDLYVFVEESLNFEDVFDGLEFTRRDDEDRCYIDHENEAIELESGYDIKRSIDGVMATIRDRGADWKRFSMLIWPDFAGNTYVKTTETGSADFHNIL